MENEKLKTILVYLQMNVGNADSMAHINNINLLTPFACSWFSLPFE
jgi:hypothetical protein